MNESFQNPVEEFIFRLCRHSFLSLWSYANPRRSNGKKELCDVLVVCEPHVIIFSIKNIQLKYKSDPHTEAERWWKNAIDKSIKQIYGAENNLSNATHVIRSDGKIGLPLPPNKERKLHRISISLGSEGNLLTYSADFGKGFVHVLDENSFMEVLTELDTILDFTDYLENKERLIEQYPNLIVDGGEKNLLTVYLHYEGNFPDEPPPPIIDSGHWEKLLKNKQYQEFKKANKRSYIWDRLIEYISESVLKGDMEFKNSLSDDEKVLRFLARENRYSRLLLSDIFKDFLIGAKANKIKSRMSQSLSGIGYVFLNNPSEYDRKDRRAELCMRCFIARSEITNCSTIIGIGINVEPAKQGFATDMFLLSTEIWTNENKLEAERLKKEFGFFNNPELKTYEDIK